MSWPTFRRRTNGETGNGAAFFSSFAIFSLATFFPLFIQGALAKTPAQLGLAMVGLSLGWSLGALFCGQIINRTGSRACSVAGALCLLAGSGLSLLLRKMTLRNIIKYFSLSVDNIHICINK